MASRVEIACLLPARNAAGDLPEFLESAARVCDAVVALDDGSTDDTHAILEASPLVAMTLTNPRRASAHGWDDGANRNRLLRAAAELEPEWIISLDADERLDADDAEALRGFIQRDALRGCAYGLRHFRMWGPDRFEPAPTWIYRLFAWEPDQQLPEQRLHFNPIPTSIPRSRWIRTTVRVKHVGAATEERRQARLAKYGEADPGAEYPTDFGGLAGRPPEELPLWAPRPADLPVLDPDTAAGTDGFADDANRPDEDADPPGTVDDLDLEGPVLSAIVISRNDEATIERTLRTVAEQECSLPFEVIVVTSGTDRTASIVRSRFPEVTLVELDRPALPGEARNAGLRVARGDYVSFPGSHVELPPGSLEARMEAHEQGYAMVTGTTLNGTRTCAGWASYFLDHSSVLPGRPSELLHEAPAHCSYHRDHLEQLGGFPEGLRAGEDTIVNRQLAARGRSAYRARDVRLIHRSPCRTPIALARHHFVRGRGLGRILLREHRHSGRMLDPDLAERLLVRYVPRRLRRTSAQVKRWGGPLRRVYRRCLPLVALGAASTCAGAWYELLRPARGKARILFGTPGTTLLVAGIDGWSSDRWGGRADAVVLVRVDFIDRSVRVVNVPRTLLVDIPGAGRGMLSAVHAVGRWSDGSDPDAGMRLLRATLERALGIRIDDHVSVDFYGFRRIVDRLGGVEVDVPVAIEDEGRGFAAYFPAGPNHLDGARALDYARTRKADSQRGREGRHLEVLLAMVRAARRVRSPARAARVAREVKRSIATSLTPRRAVRIARAVVGPPFAAVQTAGAPAELLEHVLTDEGLWAEDSDLSALGPAVAEALGTVPPARPEPHGSAAVTVPTTSGYSGPVEYRDGKPMRPDVAEAFDRMAAAARAEAGVTLTVNSALRSDAEQARIYATRPDPDWVAPPGSSYHRYGTELDIGPPAAWAWLAENAGRFGFERRYEREPWHYGLGPLPAAPEVLTPEPGVRGG